MVADERIKLHLGFMKEFQEGKLGCRPTLLDDDEIEALEELLALRGAALLDNKTNEIISG
jgi:hypothetical protein